MTSRPTIRPRPLDLAKPLKIIKSNADLKNEDDIVVARALPVIATGVEKAEEEEKHLKEALLASLVGDDRRKITLQIPIPVFGENEDYATQMFEPWHRPEGKFIEYGELEALQAAQTVEYEADHVDEKFLADTELGISAEQLEKVIDSLERFQAHQPETVTFPNTRHHCFGDLADPIPKEIYKHWRSRREARKGRSFLRAFQLPPKLDDPDLTIAFRPRDLETGELKSRSRVNNYESFLKLQRLRQDFDDLLNLFADVSKREHIKADLSRARFDLCKARARDVLATSSEKKKKKKAIPKAAGEGVAGAAATKGDLDEYMFDDAGRQFVAQMTFAKGHFVDNGLNPYDYRVREASALRYSNLKEIIEALPKMSAVVDIQSSELLRPRLSRGGRLVYDRLAEPVDVAKKTKYSQSSPAFQAFTGGESIDRSMCAGESRALLDEFEETFEVPEFCEWPSLKRRKLHDGVSRDDENLDFSAVSDGELDLIYGGDDEPLVEVIESCL